MNMGLTPFLKRKQTKKLFSDTFEKPKIKLEDEIRAPVLSSKYMLLGTAFDYLMKIHLKYHNSEAIFENCTAKKAVQKMDERSTDEEYEKVKNSSNTSVNRLCDEEYKQAKDYFDFAIETYNLFLKSGKINEDLLRSSIYLAHLDQYYYSRTRYIKNSQLIIDPDDILELNNLIKAVDFSQFKAESQCILSPRFNDASKLVGGAEADILIDNKLIDIKTTQKLSITRDMFNQIIAYYILGRIGGVSERKINGKNVEQVGFYFARHGILCLFDVKKVINYRILPEYANMPNFYFRLLSDEMKEEIIETKIMPNFMSDFEQAVKEYFFNMFDTPLIYDVPDFIIAREEMSEERKARREKSWSRRLEQLDLNFH
jgi:guanylate kinase